MNVIDTKKDENLSTTNRLRSTYGTYVSVGSVKTRTGGGWREEDGGRRRRRMDVIIGGKDRRDTPIINMNIFTLRRLSVFSSFRPMLPIISSHIHPMAR